MNCAGAFSGVALRWKLAVAGLSVAMRRKLMAVSLRGTEAEIGGCWFAKGIEAKK